MPQPLLVNISEAAEMLGVSRPTLYRLIDKGSITPVHLCKRPMVRVSDLRRLAGEPDAQPVPEAAE